MHICQSLDNTITNAKCISPSDICIKIAYMSNAYIQIVLGWFLVASCSQCIVVCDDGCIYQVGGIMPYFCNHPSTFAIKYMQFQVMIDLVWPLHIPTTYPLDSWPIFGAINDAIISHCDNCCVYHTSISIISTVPNTMRSNLIHGSRLSSNNTKVDCCISSCFFLEYSCARCSYCIAIFLLVWWQWSRCRLQPRFV